jgi:thiamine biosynthesis protein ThiS
MILRLNGEEYTSSSSSPTLSILIDELGLTGKKFAVEYNREIVPRDTYSNVILKDGDYIEIVHFIGGG